MTDEYCKMEDWLSNGLGGQSMLMLKLAAERIIPPRLSITADTGSESDRLCSTGERMSARTFWENHVKPFGEIFGIECLFVRSLDENRRELPGLIDVLRAAQKGNVEFDEMVKGISVPLFTNDRSRGRLRQSCTDKWKVRAINQEARRRGITLLRNAIGYHAGESHRIKARWHSKEGQWNIWKPQTKRDGQSHDIQWLQHYYPLVDLKLDREAIRKELIKYGLPYLITSECDMCPHQDYARWKMRSPHVIDECEAMETEWRGKLFFTDRRIPIRQALEEMRLAELEKCKQEEFPEFGCENGAYCGI